MADGLIADCRLRSLPIADCQMPIAVQCEAHIEVRVRNSPIGNRQSEIGNGSQSAIGNWHSEMIRVYNQ